MRYLGQCDKASIVKAIKPEMLYVLNG